MNKVTWTLEFEVGETIKELPTSAIKIVTHDSDELWFDNGTFYRHGETGAWDWINVLKALKIKSK